MAAERDGSDDYATPAFLRRRSTEAAAASSATSNARRPTSHRRPSRPAQRPVPLRTSAALALVTGLAITTPLLLRTPKHEIALGPERADPGLVTGSAGAPTTGGSADAPDSPDSGQAQGAAGAAAAGGRTTTPVSRDATRTPTTPPAGSPTPAARPSTGSAAASSAASSAVSSGARTGNAPAAQLSPSQAAAFEDQVVALTNAQRTTHGCPALRADAQLHLAAIEHSVDMRARGYFAHDTPDGVTPWTRVEAQGYPDPSAENIAMGQPTPQAVVDAWMNSPGHRANILNCASKAIGVGVQFGPGGPWWTQDFGYS
jgi:uncharacterized protein YkwD